MDNLMDYTTLGEECKNVCEDETTLDLVLLYLQKMKKAHVETIPDGSKVRLYANSLNSKFVCYFQKGILSVGALTNQALANVSKCGPN